MKNKLLVSVFAMGIAVFAFTSCETKSNVTDVCSDMIKESLHKSARSLVQLEGQKLTISEYEFVGGVNDDRMVYRTISFGNGVAAVKKVDSLTYEYGEWNQDMTAYTLHITPQSGAPYDLTYSGNSFITPEGLVIGGEALDNTARVDKWEKAINAFSNTEWEALFEDEFVMDSIFRDSVRATFIPPMTFKYDTIQWFTGEMDTLSADTSCYFRLEVYHNASSNANTGRFYTKSVRTTYDRETQKTDTVSVNETVKNFVWYFSEVTSDSKFVITIEPTDADAEKLSISKFKLDETGKAIELLLGGLTYTRPVNP